MSPPSRPQTVVGAVVVADGRVLAARRTRPPELAGHWEFPGGKVEPDEDPAVALRREIAEELDLAVTVGVELAGPDGAWPISSAYELRLFVTAVADDRRPTAGADHDQLRWLGPAELDSVAWLPADRQALGAVAAYIAELTQR